MSAELSQLKQEVAELWVRYRTDMPASVEDEGRKALSEQNRNLEAKRRALSGRSATARYQLELQRKRASRLSPVVRVLGGAIGSVLTAVGLGSLIPELATQTLALAPSQGAVVVGVSLVLLALSVSRAER